jgi:hypothetical protein
MFTILMRRDEWSECPVLLEDEAIPVVTDGIARWRFVGEFASLAEALPAFERLAGRAPRQD